MFLCIANLVQRGTLLQVKKMPGIKKAATTTYRVKNAVQVMQHDKCVLVFTNFVGHSGQLLLHDQKGIGYVKGSPMYEVDFLKADAFNGSFENCCSTRG